MIKDSCIFCKIANREIPAKIIFEDDKVIAFEDIRPQAPVHVLVIPKMHIEKVSDLTDESVNVIAPMIMAANSIAKKRNIQESGYRVIFNNNKDAGQEVFHIHLHLMGGRPFSWPPG